MKNTDDVFQSLSGSFFKHSIDSLGGNNGSSVLRLLLVTLAILAFVGVEVVKVLFRQNFGKEGLSRNKAMVGSLVFGVLAGGNYYLATKQPSEQSDSFATPSVLYVTAVFHGFLALYILVKTIKEKNKNLTVIHEAYRGDSLYFDFLVNEGWTPAKVQNLAEPMTLLGLGVFLSAVNLLWGIPLIVCALSVWGYIIFEKFYGMSDVRDILANQEYKKNSSEDFVEISN